MRYLVILFNLIHIVMVYIAKFLMVAMVLITFANVVLRYGFNSGLVWSEEVALLLADWFIFIAMSLGVKQDLHINLSLIAEHRIADRINRLLVVVRTGIYFVIGVSMLIFGWNLTLITMKSIMPATHWPAGLLYAILPISAIVIIYEAVADLFAFETKDAEVDRFLAGEGSLQDVLGGKNA